MVRGSPRVEQKSDIFVGSRMDVYNGLIVVEEESYFVVDCPSLHIVSGNNIGPRRQAETDVGLKIFIFFLFYWLAQDDLVLTVSEGLLDV